MVAPSSVATRFVNDRNEVTEVEEWDDKSNSN
jgi:hypothetical protein